METPQPSTSEREQKLGPMDAHALLMGRTVRIENIDRDMLNVVDVEHGTRYWIESTGMMLVFMQGGADVDRT